MSKALKKLIDINRLREFKNKLVGVGSAYVQTSAVDQTIAGTKTFSKPIVGSVTGNAATATKLAAARTINGTSFNGTANITTANWGTARNISITDGTNTSTAVSVNGSANVSLNLPATIKANLTGNSDTATKATQDSAGQQIDTTYIKGLAVSGRTITYTKGDGTTGTITTQDTNTDAKVTQTVTTTNAEYPVLFSADANKTATSTTTARFSSNTKINPSTNTITATTFKGNLTGNVTGNASTATNATYTNWLRTSSHSDHLFHTEWDNAGYFWTYVTAGDGGYRAVRVARSDSAATAQACTGNAATATKATQDSDGNKITTTYSKNGHTHDDRYYTEAEVNNLLARKANSSHTHPYIPTSASCNKNWNWSGQGGQPSWLWGGEDGTNMYVYNPSNFSVNYANSAGYATTAGNGVDSSGDGWIRFRNGIQICWDVIRCGTSGSSRWTYGASFSSDPVVTVCDQGRDTNIIYLTRAGNIGTASCLIVMVDENRGSYAPGEAQCIAIGRWK